MENRLEHLEKFQEILADYHLSPHGKKILKNVRFLALSGLSSSGRNTIIRELIKTGNYHYVVSDTTRNPRINDGVLEKSGVEYWFKTENQMLKALQAGEMLEAEIIHGQQISGISIAELERAKNEDKIAVTDIEVGGFSKILREKQDTIGVFLLPPSFKEWQKRMNNRGNMPSSERKRRLNTAIQVLETALSTPEATIIVNHDFHETVKLFNDLDNFNPDQEEGRKVARELLKGTKKALDNN